jgi:CubicO group peptidase (beta-lactamase class C family)
MRFTPVVVLVALVAAMAPMRASEALPEAEVDPYVQGLIDNEWCQSLTVGLIKPDGSRSVYGYGRTSAGAGGREPDGKTVYEIGSVTKAFTGVLLAEMVKRGDVALDDPVQKYLPDTLKLPQKGDRPITLLDLATHRSGIPRMPDNFAPKEPGNPYADYGVDRMYTFLRGWKPQRAPGEAYEYSNLGTGLLGHVLALKAGKTYEALLTERVLKPAGMGDTSIALSDGQRKRLAPPHNAELAPAANWDIPTFAGAGALRSTTDDMLKFLRVALSDDAELSKVFPSSYENRARAGGDNDIGLGWHINSKSKAVWHNGETGGYHSYCAFVPGKGGVVVLANTGTGMIDDVGIRLLMKLIGEPSEPPTVKPSVKLKPETLKPLLGVYPLAPNFALTITRDGEKLYLQATDQPRFRLFAVSETEFYLRVVDARVTFDQPVDGKCPRLVLYQNGQVMPGPRR